MSENKDHLIPEHNMLADKIRKMDLREVPPSFSSSVMDSILKEKTPLWKRILRWINSPIELRLTPLKAGIALALIVMAVFFHPMEEQVYSPETKVVSVRFEFKAPDGEIRNVAVIGSFNQWSAESSAMRYNNETGIWIYETKLRPGEHEYVFLVDGNKAVPDPRAAYYREDGFGSINSIVSVGGNDYEI